MPYLLLGEPAYNLYNIELTRLGFTPVSLPADNVLNKVVSFHADTLIFSDGSNHLANGSFIDSLDERIKPFFTPVPEHPHGDYPTDTVLNGLVIGRFLFAGASLAPSVVHHATVCGLEIRRVNQGYAKCSVLALSGTRSAITADAGMEKALKEAGIDVLRIRPGFIGIDGCEYGFIGGASFVYEPKCCCSLSDRSRYVYFFGDIHCHPDSEAIHEFLSKKGYTTVSLGGKLYDFGGAVIIE